MMTDCANELCQATAENKRLRWQLNQAEDWASSAELRLEGCQETLDGLRAKLAEPEDLRVKAIEIGHEYLAERDAKLAAAEKETALWRRRTRMLSRSEWEFLLRLADAEAKIDAVTAIVDVARAYRESAESRLVKELEGALASTGPSLRECVEKVLVRWRNLHLRADSPCGGAILLDAIDQIQGALDGKTQS